ncbi:hypothetical protein [Cereibacter sphaeroides]|uniref:hypothetical protein n=1 Tax=Cereibacter sphaeroides TaxID=1063 RepID=UPI0021566150|nr:hypothetical protein [Cereibacter sphaeroides]
MLPAVPIPYFNTVTRKVEAAEIPALPIGYASFAASQSAGIAITPASLWGGLAAGLAGLGARDGAARGRPPADGRGARTARAAALALPPLADLARGTGG